MRANIWLKGLLTIGFTLFSSLQAEIRGKIDNAPAYLHIDVLESGKTVHTVNMGAWRAEAAISPLDDCGWVIKPLALYGTSFEGSQLFMGGLGIGHFLPVHERVILVPSVGVQYTFLETYTDIFLEIDPDLPPLFLADIRERFQSVSPYVALEGVFSIFTNFRICASIQYSWSRTNTHLHHVGSSNSRTQGFSYSALMEYDLCSCWSLNLGGAYNVSLSKEKHGLRGAGAKIGLSFWF